MNKKPGDWCMVIKSLPEDGEKRMKRMIVLLELFCVVPFWFLIAITLVMIGVFR